MQIKTGMIPAAQKVVIYGPEGVGKTSFASNFPDPLFIDTEGGTKQLDVKRADPSPTSWEMLLGYVREVAADPTLCATLVIDTADWAEQLCIVHVCNKHGVKGVEDFGWGKGYTYVKEEFGHLLNLLQDVIEHGVNVVVCAHSQIKKIEQPDEMGSYDRWEMKLSKQAAPLLKEWADILLFATYKTIVTVKDNGKGKAQGNRRVMRANHSAAWDAKNRCSLPDEMDLDYLKIAHVIPVRTTSTPIQASTPQAIPHTDTTPAQPAQPDEQVMAEVSSQSTENPDPVPEAEPRHLKPLRDLMAKDGVNDAELQDACAQMGYCTVETPISVYPTDFAAYLAASWDDVLAKVKERKPYTEDIPF